MSLDALARYYHQSLSQYAARVEKKLTPIESQQQEAEGNFDFLTADVIYQQGTKVMKSNKFFATSLLGSQGTGKTTIIQKLIDCALQDGMKIVYALPEDFMDDIDAWVARVIADPADSYCVVIDDMSYSMDTAKRSLQAKVKNVISRFRHKFHGEMFVIYVTHRYHAAPPIMRNAWTWIFTTMQPADREDALKIIGRGKEQREHLESIYQFISDVSVRGPDQKRFVLEYGKCRREFIWGDQDEPGDGRLMTAFHMGKLYIFNSVMTEDELDLDLEQFRFTPSSEHEDD